MRIVPSLTCGSNLMNSLSISTFPFPCRVRLTEMSGWVGLKTQQNQNKRTNITEGLLTCTESGLTCRRLTVESQSPSEWGDWSHQTQKCKLYCWTPERSCLGCHWNYKHRSLEKGNIKLASFLSLVTCLCQCRPDVGAEDAPCRFQHHLVSAWLSPCNIKIRISRSSRVFLVSTRRLKSNICNICFGCWTLRTHPIKSMGYAAELGVLTITTR